MMSYTALFTGIGLLGSCPLTDTNRQLLSEAAVGGLLAYVKQESMFVRACVCNSFSSHFSPDHVGTAGQAIILIGCWTPSLSAKAMEDLVVHLKVLIYMTTCY